MGEQSNPCTQTIAKKICKAKIFQQNIWSKIQYTIILASKSSLSLSFIIRLRIRKRVMLPRQPDAKPHPPRSASAGREGSMYADSSSEATIYFYTWPFWPFRDI